jgi:hypothetical protein
MAFRDVISRLAPWSWIPAVVLWVTAIWIWLDRLVGVLLQGYNGWLFDWHVYLAAARDFVNHDLYKVPLVYDVRLPVSSFNYPPGSAAAAVPFLVLPDEVGGVIWVLLGIASVAVVSVLAMHIVGARPIWLWAGALFFVYSFTEWGALPALLGNNTPMVLLLVAGGVAAHLGQRQTLAGILLGVAIAMKLWPAALLVPLARERSWQAAGWAVGTATAITAAGLIWLGGLDVVRPMISAMLIEIVPREEHILIGLTWLRVHTDWWPEWGGYAVAVLLLLFPVKGRLGYGVAMIAGLAAIPNLWRHYLPTVAFAIVLIIGGLLRRREGASVPEARQPAESVPRLDDPATQA